MCAGVTHTRKSTICSRVLGCALFSSSGAISCFYPSFGTSALWERQLFLTCLLLLGFCVFLTRCSGRQMRAAVFQQHKQADHAASLSQWFLERLDILHHILPLFSSLLSTSSLSSAFFLSLLPLLHFHSGQLSLVQLDCFVRAHHLHSD